MIQVGSHGFVELIDHMGNDSTILDSARISYGKGTKATSTDETLMFYLMRHQHTSPFEQMELQFHVKVPMDIWRQWIRHRTASINEYSTRYSEVIEDMAVTPPDKWRKQSKDNKQGSDGYLDIEDGRDLSEDEAIFRLKAKEIYQKRLEMGVAREQARKDIPLSTYTLAVWKINLHNLFHFLELRLHPHAQQEIREYAQAIYDLARPLAPLAFAAFTRYRLRATRLSEIDSQVIKNIMQNCKSTPVSYTEFLNMVPSEWQGKRCREREECFDKLVKLAICYKD